MRTLYEYINDAFHKSIKLIFPEIDNEKYLLRFFISQNNFSDFCTPVARQLVSLTDLSDSQTIAQKIIETIEPDRAYLSPKIISSNGFINLCISPDYLIMKLSDNCYTSVMSLKNPSIDFCDSDLIIDKLNRILLYADSLGKYNYDQSDADCTLLSGKEELTLLKLLALADFPELNTGKVFFIRKLLTASEEMYKKIPLICKDDTLSMMRLQLIRAVMNKIEAYLR